MLALALALALSPVHTTRVHGPWTWVSFFDSHGHASMDMGSVQQAVE